MTNVKVSLMREYSFVECLMISKYDLTVTTVEKNTRQRQGKKRKEEKNVHGSMRKLAFLEDCFAT